jgi:hypothetical protein
MLGNLLFGVTFLFYIGLVIFNFPKPALAGERAMGYGLGLAFFGLGFVVCSLLLMFFLGSKNVLDWVSTSDVKQNLVLWLGWLSFAAATFFCAAFKWEWHGEFPMYIRRLSLAQAEIWLPLLMLVPAALLLNMERQAGTAPLFVKIPMSVGFAISLFISLGLLFGWYKTAEKQQLARIEGAKEQNDKLHNEHLAFITEQKPTDPILNIMALTGRFHDEDVREAAVAKVKSHPNWEAELLELLDNDYYHTEAYTFIDGNNVDHPERFVEPLNRSIRRLAMKIKDQIKDSNNLQDWHFENYGIERLLRAIDEQFSQLGMDFQASVRELRKALDTPKPERFNKVQFNVTPLVDAWLKAHY